MSFPKGRDPEGHPSEQVIGQWSGVSEWWDERCFADDDGVSMARRVCSSGYVDRSASARMVLDLGRRPGLGSPARVESEAGL